MKEPLLQSDIHNSVLNTDSRKKEITANDIHFVNKQMANIAKEIGKVFPRYIDIGFVIHDALPNADESIVYFVCGTDTLVKFTQKQKLLQSLNIPGKKLKSLCMANDSSLLYVSTANKEIIEVDTENLVIKREIMIDYTSTELISYDNSNSIIYGLTDSCIFSIKLNHESGPICKEKFKGNFGFFSYNSSEWLLGYRSGEIKKIDKDQQEFSINLQGNATKVKWSRSQNYIIALVSISVYILTLELKVLKEFVLRSKPLHATMIENDTFIVASTEDGDINIINFLIDKITPIKVHKGKISTFVVNKKFTLITTFGHDSKIGYLKVPPSARFKIQDCSISCYIFSGSGSEVIYIENSKSIFLWDFVLDTKSLLYNDSKALSPALCLLPMHDSLVFSDTSKIILFNMTSREVTFSILLEGKDSLTSFCTDSHNKYLFALPSKSNFIHIYDIEQGSNFGLLKGHSARITCQMLLTESDSLVTGGNDNALIIWDYNEQIAKHILIGHTQPITSIAATIDEKKIISGSRDQTIKVWCNQTGQLLITFHAHSSPIVSLKIDKTNSLVSSSDDGMAIYWNLTTHAKVFAMTFESQLRSVEISPDNRFFSYSNAKQLVITEFQGYLEKFAVVGPDMSEKYDYMSYILKIIKGDKVGYEKKWDSWVVLPYQFNTLYFYSYANMHRYIAKSIMNKCSLIPSFHIDPFTMIIHKNYSRCLRAFFTLSSELLEENLYALCFVSGEIMTKLNLQGHNQLHLLYESIFRKYESDDLPKFVNISNLPKTVLSATLLPVSGNFFPNKQITEEKVLNQNTLKLKLLTRKNINETVGVPTQISGNFAGSVFESHNGLGSDNESQDDDESEEEVKMIDVIDEIESNKNLVPAVLYISSIRMDYEAGSPMSVKFLSSLRRCPNKEIFRTKFIQSLLDMKWKQCQKYQMIQAVSYAIYITVLVAYLLLFYKTMHGVLNLLIVGCLIALYDIYQVFLSLEIFLRDIFNYLDVLRILSLIVYSVLFINNAHFQVEAFTLVASVSLLRGLWFFKLFRETRYMVQLIMTVLSDIWALGLLLAYSGFVFSLLLMIQGLERSNDGFFEYLINSLLINLGELHYDENNALEVIIIMTAASANMIFMLNMLIAIMSDTFGNVTGNVEIANYSELIGLILEVEISISKHKKRKEYLTYFQQCEEESIPLKRKDILAQDIKIMKKLLANISETVAHIATVDH